MTIAQMQPPLALPGWKTVNIGGTNMMARQWGPVRGLLTWDNYPDPTTENASMGGPGTYRHLSLSCADRYPSWDEMKEIVYNSGVFDNRFDVLMILPPQSKPDEYVNVHKNTFHWVQKVGGWR